METSGESAGYEPTEEPTEIAPPSLLKGVNDKSQNTRPSFVRQFSKETNPDHRTELAREIKAARLERRQELAQAQEQKEASEKNLRN